MQGFNAAGTSRVCHEPAWCNHKDPRKYARKAFAGWEIVKSAIQVMLATEQPTTSASGWSAGPRYRVLCLTADLSRA